MCFCCFGEGHLGQSYNHTRVCGIDNCKEVHHRLFHKAQGNLPGDHSRRVENEKKEEPQLIVKQDESTNESNCCNEGESKDRIGQLDDTYTTVTQPGAAQTSGTIALRTIPVYLKNGTRKIKVNALLVLKLTLI